MDIMPSLSQVHVYGTIYLQTLPIDLQANKGNDCRRMPKKGEGSASVT